MAYNEGVTGRVTRRRVLRWGAAGGAAGLSAAIVVPTSWRAAFADAKPFKIGTMQPLSGAAAIIGKTALVGVQMAVDRINKAGGINGRPVELIVADYESKPDVGRRKAEKLVEEDKIDAHVGAFLQVERHLAQRLIAVGRVHLIGALVGAAQVRFRADRIAERAVEGGRVFCRI